jgi:hypothetical protein
MIILTSNIELPMARSAEQTTKNIQSSGTIIYNPTEDPPYELTISTIGQGTIITNPLGPYSDGTEVTLTAVPSSGWEFSGWRGALLPLGTTNPATLVMTKDRWVQANFTEIPADQEDPPPGESLKVLRFEDHGGFGTEKLNAEFVVEHTDMYRAGPWMTAIPDPVHALDPDLPIIVYRDFMNINDLHGYWDTAVANNWLLKDTNGDFVYAVNHPNNKIADRASPSFMQYTADLVQSFMDDGFDGVFADNGIQIYPNDQWTMSARPVNPRTGQLYTDLEWFEDTLNFMDYIKAEVPDAIIIANGMPFSGHFFYQHQAQLEDYLTRSTIDGKFIEGAFNNFDGLYTESKWKESVDMIVRFQEFYLSDPSKSIVIWCPNTAIPADMTENQMSLFIFTSSLLGVSRTNQNYISGHNDMDSAFTQSLFDIDLGIPLEDYHEIGGTHLYERQFSTIRVIVNPTDTARSIDLGGSYIDLDGQTISSLTLTKYSGAILEPIS